MFDNDRPVLTRVLADRPMPRVRRAGPRYPAPLPQPVRVQGYPRVAGCCAGEDLISSFAMRAQQCLPPAVQKRMGCDPNNPNGAGGPNGCASPTRRVPVGGANAVAVVANGAFAVTITLAAAFFPVMIGIPALTAVSLTVTGIQYGTVNKLIGTQVAGEAFSYANETGGYVLEGAEWLTSGQTIVITGTSVAAFAIGALAIDVHGLTNVPG